MFNYMAAEKRWENIETLRKEMAGLAEEIIELEGEGNCSDRLIRLYDLSDSVFSAKNVKRLLAVLEKAEQRSAVNGLSYLCSRQSNGEANQRITELETKLATGFTDEALAQEERAENAEQELSLARARITELEEQAAFRRSRHKSVAARKKARFELQEKELKDMTESNRNHVLALERAKNSISELLGDRLGVVKALKEKLATPVRLPDYDVNDYGYKSFSSDEVVDAIHAAGFSIEKNFCSACNERYCGNCAHSNGAIVR